MDRHPIAVENYLEAGRNKIGLARRHLEELNKLRAGEPSEREEIQMHFEGDLKSRAGSSLNQAKNFRLVGHGRAATRGRLKSAIIRGSPADAGFAWCL